MDIRRADVSYELAKPKKLLISADGQLERLWLT